MEVFANLLGVDLVVFAKLLEVDLVGNASDFHYITVLVEDGFDYL